MKQGTQRNMKRDAQAIPKPDVALPVVIDARLPCEACGRLHVDEGEFARKAHHTHSCQFCGLTWRPMVPFSRGVRFLPGFKDPGEPLQFIDKNGGTVR